MNAWFDCKKQHLPQPFQRVLVFVPGFGVYQGWSRGDIGRSPNSKRWNVGGTLSNNVTHWMPLPKPPMTATETVFDTVSPTLGSQSGTAHRC